MSAAERLVSQLVMVGVISELDEAAARVRVDVDGLLSDWLPFAAGRAGPGVREWAAPEVGEQVVVASPYGDPSQGVVLGSIYQDAHGAPANLKTIRRTEFADGAFIQYDRDGHQYAIDVPAGGAITLHIGQTTLKLEDGRATLTTPEYLVDSPQTTFTGAVTVQGALAYQSGMSGQGGATVAGSVSVSGGDVTADAHSLKGHKHPGVATGSGQTGAAIP